MLSGDRLGDGNIARGTDVIWLKPCKLSGKLIARDRTYDKHPVGKRPILFARVQFRNLCVGGHNVGPTTNAQEDVSEGIYARMIRKVQPMEPSSSFPSKKTSMGTTQGSGCVESVAFS